MTNVNVYNDTAKRLLKLAVANDTTVAEIVEMLTDYIDDMVKDFNLVK